MNREDVSSIMVHSRLLIESADNPDDYRVARFYVDWTVHTALHRSIAGCEVLRDITRALAENVNPTRPDITREVSRIIGLPRLRSELMELFRNNGLPQALFAYQQNWADFVAFLTWFLAEQPIKWPDKPRGRASEIQAEMLALDRPHNLSVEALALVDWGGVCHWQLQVAGDKEYTMMGPLEIAEDADRFLPPPQSGTAAE